MKLTPEQANMLFNIPVLTGKDAGPILYVRILIFLTLFGTPSEDSPRLINWSPLQLSKILNSEPDTIKKYLGYMIKGGWVKELKRDIKNPNGKIAYIIKGLHVTTEIGGLDSEIMNLINKEEILTSKDKELELVETPTPEKVEDDTTHHYNIHPVTGEC